MPADIHQLILVDGPSVDDLDDTARVARGLGNRAVSDLVNGCYGTCYTGLCYGFNAFWCDGFEVETLINVGPPPPHPQHAIASAAQGCGHFEFKS